MQRIRIWSSVVVVLLCSCLMFVGCEQESDDEQAQTDESESDENSPVTITDELIAFQDKKFAA